MVCPVHGPFEQIPMVHLKSPTGCKDCTKETRPAPGTLTQETYLEKAKLKHGDRYDYSKTVYTGALNKLTIVCKEHGSFPQTASKHLEGRGCPECGKMAGGAAVSRSTESFIDQARKVHGGRYDYSKVHYVRGSLPVKIICNEHGPFNQRPDNHVLGDRPSGCPECGKIAIGKASEGTNLTNHEVKDKIKVIYGDQYDLSQVKYVLADTPLSLVCKDHGYFEKSMHALGVGKGCNLCSIKKQHPDADTFYITKIVRGDETIFKVGITSQLKVRTTGFRKVGESIESKVTVLFSVPIKSIDDLVVMEENLRRAMLVYFNHPTSKFSGYTESFVVTEKEIPTLAQRIPKILDLLKKPLKKDRDYKVLADFLLCKT